MKLILLLMVLLSFQVKSLTIEEEMAFIYAQENGAEHLEKLIGQGLNLNIRDQTDRTLLHVAAENGSIKTAQLLLELRADLSSLNQIGRSPLHLAAKHSNLEMVKILVGSGASVNIKDRFGYTSLHLATREKRFEIVKFLVESGAEINIIDGCGDTPLIDAVYSDAEAVVRFLLDNYADMTIQGMFGFMASDISSGNIDKMLVQEPARRNLEQKSLEVARSCLQDQAFPSELAEIVCDYIAKEDEFARQNRLLQEF